MVAGVSRGVTISTPPANVTVVAGQPATFSVGIVGEGPLHYQWRRRGFALAGETRASFTMVRTSRADADVYDVLVSDAAGSLASPRVELRVNPAKNPDVVAFEANTALLVEDALGASAVQKIILAPDGKMIVVGEFAAVNGRRRRGVVRFNADLTLDETFVPPQISSSRLHTVVLQPDGKLLLAGYTVKVNGESLPDLFRLNSDGSYDPSFRASFGFASFQVSAVAARADGKLWVGEAYGHLVRLDASGRAEFTLPFGLTGVGALALLPDGRLLVAHGASLLRINRDDSIDASFAPGISGGRISSIAVQGDGKIVVAGQINGVGGVPRPGIARLYADGSLDQSFSPGLLTGASTATCVALEPGGRIVATGQFVTAVNAAPVFAVRLNSDGTRDATFAPDISGSVTGYAEVVVSSAVARADGKIVLGGGFTTVG